MSALRVFLIWGLLSASILKSSAGPEPVRIENGVRKLGIVQTIGKLALERYVKQRLPFASGLSEDQKYQYFKQNEEASVAILLHEFVSGTGPTVRYLDERYAFVRQMKNGPAMRYLFSEFERLRPDTLSRLHLRYQFSALPAHPGTWGFSIVQHAETLGERNLSQFMLGSFFADFKLRNNGSVRVHIWNITSRKSYFLGQGERVQRPLLFGNVTQRISMDFTSEEWLALAAGYGKRSKDKKNPAWSGKVLY
ncbi:MAG: hypothetical protein H6606_07490 [Flavobacteriales bacterium]|nr:hypothetical protein [Flavobacteriales bacterium]